MFLSLNTALERGSDTVEPSRTTNITRVIFSLFKSTDKLLLFHIFFIAPKVFIGYSRVTSNVQIGTLVAPVSKLLLKTIRLTNETNACPVLNTELFKINFIPKEL